MANRNISIRQVGVISFTFLEKWKRSLLILICLFIPGILLAGAYVHMAIRYEKLWLFNIIVHERGKYTLLEVIFYFRHFLWEVLIKMVYSLFIVGTFYFYGKPLVTTGNSEVSNIPVRKILVSGVFALGLILLSIFMTAKDVGFNDTIMGLFQYRTHELSPLEFGSHWRNHFLSNIVLFSASAFSVLLYRRVNDGGCWIKRRFSKLLPISFGIFIFLTLFFGLTMDPFETPSYLGHQLREIFGTDLSITMFLTMAMLIYLERKYSPGEIPLGSKEQENRKRIIPYLVCWSFPVVLITGFLIIKIMALDISGEIAKLGSTQGWSTWDLFAWHFFEHSLDYVFTVSLVYFIYLLTLKIELKEVVNEK